jgi:hypothetical protein
MKCIRPVGNFHSSNHCNEKEIEFDGKVEEAMAQLNNVMKYPTTYYRTKDIPHG